MNPYIEKAYRAWRATARDDARVIRLAQQALNRGDALRRKYAGTGRWERTPEHREIARKAALKRWAKARRSA